MQLKRWFLEHRRSLPWREEPTPYAVWVSEIMLQQTQVSVVIPYFERWMQRFPTIQALADAPLEAVLKAWEGLGYYSRARNLHAGARYVVEYHHGELPASAEYLQKIKGLGDYTVGAIQSFAFHQRAAAVDGNVLRVLARYFGLADDISKGTTQRKFREIALGLLPQKEPWIVSEALIELGATICTRNPKCVECPLRSSCQAYAKGIAETLPVKSAKVATKALYRLVAVVSCQGRLLVGRAAKGKIMADLFEFPYIEIESSTLGIEEQKRHLHVKLQQEMVLRAHWKRSLPEVKHSFTRYRALLMPHYYIAKEIKPVDGYEWLTVDELKEQPFSSGHRKILSQKLLIE